MFSVGPDPSTIIGIIGSYYLVVGVENLLIDGNVIGDDFPTKSDLSGFLV